MTTTWNTIQNSANDLGPELIINGNFAGNADGWNVNSGWAYGGGKLVHTPGDDTGADPQDSITMVPFASYTFSAFIGGTAGVLSICAADNPCFDYPAGVGEVTFTFVNDDTVNADIGFNPSLDFDGYFANVSFREVVPTAWTSLNKPSGTSYTNYNKASGTSYTKLSKPGVINVVNGSPIGLLLALTYAGEASVTWTDISNPSTSWTNIPKAS